MRRFARWLGRIIAATLLIAFALWLVAYGRQWLLRWRAERLLADIQALQVHESSWADAQKLMTRWGAWGTHSGSCTAAKCDYAISMNDMLPLEYQLSWEDPSSFYDSPRRLRRVLDRSGLRTSIVYASFSVSHAIVTSKRFDATVLTPVRYRNGPDQKIPMELTAAATEGFHLNVLPDTYDGDIYSVVTTGSRGGDFAHSTPMEPLQHRQALMAFRLNCITQWSPCLRVEDILPQAASEAHARGDFNHQIENCDGRRLEFLARDEPEVWVASVEAKPEHDPDSPDQSKLRYRIFVSPQRLLKSRHHVALGNFIPTFKVDSQASATADSNQQVLFFTDDADYSLPPHLIDLRSCSLTPVTPENLAAVQKGIAEDFGHD